MMTEVKIKELTYSIMSRTFVYHKIASGVGICVYTIGKNMQVLHTLLYSSAHLHMCRGIWDLYHGNQVGR